MEEQMPEGNESAYKEMYEMGQKLMEMAKAGGYDPSASTDSEGSEEMGSTPSPEGSKVDTAMSFL